MNSLELTYEIAKILDSKKGEDIKAIRIQELTSIGDYFVIASGANDVWGDPERYQQVYFYDGMRIKVPDDMEVELEPSVYTRPENAVEYRFYEQTNGN